MLSSDLVFAMYGSKDPQTRALAIKYGHLHITDRKQYAELIKLGLQDSDVMVRLDAFRNMDDVIEFLDLDSMIRSEANAAIRNAAISYLTENIKPMENLLLKLLTDADSDVVLFAIQIISKDPTPELVKACKEFLYSLDTNVTQAAIEVMVAAHEKSVVPTLHKLLTQNVWLELVILDALVKLDDNQVYSLIEDRIRSKSEMMVLIFVVMMSNPSLRFLDMLRQHAASFLSGTHGTEYLQTVAGVALSVSTDPMELERFYLPGQSSVLPYHGTPSSSVLTDNERLGSGLLMLWGILTDDNWNVTEFLDLILLYDKKSSLTNLIVDSLWLKILQKLTNEPFSLSVFDLLIQRRPAKVESYLQSHPTSLKVQIDVILERMNAINLPLPEFMYDSLKLELSLVSLTTLKATVLQNRNIAKYYGEILSLHPNDDELTEILFDSLYIFETIPEQMVKLVETYAISPDFQKRMISVKGVFFCHQLLDRQVLNRLMNDSVLEIRLKFYQNALDFSVFYLIDDLVLQQFIDPVEIFYLSRWIFGSDHPKVTIILENLHDRTVGALQDQIKKMLSQHRS